ncbi:MAG TPA: hypothetical protein VJ914_07015 [Pseudonocardiaceae bacterium]|nr:hypothetical protein [Pseudonocardiaceae bacterium]
MAFSSPAGAVLVVAAAACAIGALLPPVLAAVLAGMLLVAGVVAFSINRAEHVLDTIFKEELPPPDDLRRKKTA